MTRIEVFIYTGPSQFVQADISETPITVKHSPGSTYTVSEALSHVKVGTAAQGTK